jgi:hypothetical protein
VSGRDYWFWQGQEDCALRPREQRPWTDAFEDGPAPPLSAGLVWAAVREWVADARRFIGAIIRSYSDGATSRISVVRRARSTVCQVRSQEVLVVPTQTDAVCAVRTSEEFRFSSATAPGAEYATADAGFITAGLSGGLCREGGCGEEVEDER